MIKLPSCINTFVSGPVASGKTFLLKQWLESLTRVCVFDATGEFVSDSSFEHIWMSPRQFFSRLEVNEYAFRIAYHPGRNVLEDFEWTIRAMFQFDSVKTLAVDEFHLVCPNNAIGDDMEVLLRFARHAQIGLVALSQRVADVHKLFTQGCRMVVLFYTEESCDIEAIGKRWGYDTAKMVSSLRPLIYNDDTKTTSQIPQCVVKFKGQKARIYDFETEQFVDSKSPNVEEPTEVPENDGGMNQPLQELEETEESENEEPEGSEAQPD